VHRFIAHANVDRYIGLLNDGDLAPDNRRTITTLLIAEEDKLSHDLEHLQFAEIRAANGRERLKQIKMLREGFAFGTSERERAERILVNVENTQTMLENLCIRLRAKVNSRPL